MFRLTLFSHHSQAQTTPYDGGTVTISIKAGCEREKAEARLKELQTTYVRYTRPD